MPFVSGFRAGSAEPSQTLWFGFRGNKLLVKIEDGTARIPLAAEAGSLQTLPLWRHYFGSWNEMACYAVSISEETALSAGFEWMGLRQLFGKIEEELVWVAGRAGQLAHWHSNHRFCGRCGHPTQDHRDERAKICPACGLINHPRVSPAIIVAVVRERRLLLAHATRFPAKFYSVLAGFAEPGESLEECVRREVFEEVGVRVKHIRYFGSQPWPFPDSLMVAFTAEHAAGEIRVDPAEITDAGWFAANELPEIPPPISIARKLIDWFARQYGDERG